MQHRGRPERYLAFFFLAISVILIVACEKKIDAPQGLLLRPTDVILPLTSDSSIIHISYLPQYGVFLVGDYNNGGTWIINESGEIVGESEEELFFTSTCNGETVAHFSDHTCLDRIHIDAGQFILEPTHWRARNAFTLLPTGHLATFGVDLTNQILEIERKVEILLKADKEGLKLDEKLIVELIGAENVEEDDLASEYNQWMKLIEILEQYYGQQIGVEELSPAIKKDHLGLVKIVDGGETVLGGALEPPIVAGGGFATLRAAGCLVNNKIYMVNTLEPTLYVLEYISPEGIVGGPTIIKTERFEDQFESVPNSIFEYRPPSEEVRRRYPNTSFPFTPTWSIFSLQDNTVIARVSDHVSRKSALVFFRDGTYCGMAVTKWTPMSSDGDMLVMMKEDSIADAIVLRVFSDSQELLSFLAEESEYCDVALTL